MQVYRDTIDRGQLKGAPGLASETGDFNPSPEQLKAENWRLKAES